MRDKKRIERILNKLKIYWYKNPDLRLSQIIWNLHFQKPTTDDLFYWDDDKLEEKLDEELKNE